MLFIYLVIFYMMMVIIMLFLLFLYFFMNKIIMFMELNLMKFSSIKMEIVLMFDWVSLLFINVVLFISMMVIFYSIEYMSEEKKINQFMYLMLMFVLSMLLMVLSPNMLSILVGWDGLGLVSYCLVVYYQNSSSFNSGKVTVLTNRLGDIMILMSVGLLMSNGSLNFMFFQNMNMLIMFMLMIASFTKSAQLPFSSWLPMAMAAPTPVSSLVHSSTLVTAGVYLMIRLNYLIDSFLTKLMMLVSVLTMFLSGLGANFETDLKKIIALSTLSQLGVMFFCLSMKLIEFTLFHLLTHAMFKSMLFMCAGVIIHNFMNNQDIRLISMIYYNYPYISILFNCSTLSLCGIPFMSGFFSKDLILEMYMMGSFNKMVLVILFMSMGLTVSYSIRLIYCSFIKNSGVSYMVSSNLFNSFMGLSMYLLYFMSLMMGSMLNWILFSMKNYIYLTNKFKMLIYLFMMFGLWIGLMLNKYYLSVVSLLNWNVKLKFFIMLWFMPMLYSSKIYMILMLCSNLILKMEGGWIEYFMGLNLIKLIINLMKFDFFYKNYFVTLIYLMTIILMIYLMN